MMSIASVECISRVSKPSCRGGGQKKSVQSANEGVELSVEVDAVAADDGGTNGVVRIVSNESK